MSFSDADGWFEGFREGLRENEAERAGTGPGEPLPTDGPPDLPRYAIGERLGEGAAAVVYKAWDRDLSRSVAIKVLRDTADVRRTLRARFLREAKIAAGLDHPNLVRVFDLGEGNGRLFMVMELVEGRSLGALLSGREASMEDRLRLLEKAARGVAAAHARGIIHRDLKPANILVDRSGEPKVGDFGISLGMEPEPRLTRTGEPLGTPAYMAPEQVRGAGDPTVRTDVYALGAILYEMLTGRPPYLARSVPELYQKILEGDPEPPRMLAPDAPLAAGAVALKALSPKPADRYATADEFADELSRFLRGETVLARNPGPVRRLGRRLRTRPAAAAFLLAGAVFALATLAAALSRRTVDANRDVLRAAVARVFDREKARLEERYKGLQPVRLVAALQAATERGSESTPPEEIRDLLDYELKKLRIEPELLALLPVKGKRVYGRGPAGTLQALENRTPLSGQTFSAAEGKLWLLEGDEVRDTAPEHEGVVRGYRWIGAPIDSATLSAMVPAEAGVVAWTDNQRQVLAGPAWPAGNPNEGDVRIGGRTLDHFSEPFFGGLLPMDLHLMAEARGLRESVLQVAGLAALLSLTAAAVLLARPA